MKRKSYGWKVCPPLQDRGTPLHGHTQQHGFGGGECGRSHETAGKILTRCPASFIGAVYCPGVIAAYGEFPEPERIPSG